MNDNNNNNNNSNNNNNNSYYYYIPGGIIFIVLDENTLHLYFYNIILFYLQDIILKRNIFWRVLKKLTV